MMYFLKRIKLILVVVIGVILTSCTPSSTPVEKATKQGILLMGNSADPESLDPALSTGMGESKIIRAIFEGLVRADDSTLEVQPAVAKSWEVLDDGKKYIFYLDENARWSDGSKVTANDFVFAWRRAVSPTIAAEYASLLYVIKNAKDIAMGKEKDISKLGVKALDNYILQVELENKCSYFLSLLYHNVFFPLHEKTLRKFGADKFPNAVWTKPENIVSNGAFVLTKWSINSVASVRRNKYYRNQSAIKLNGIDFFPISNMNTEDRAFRAGQLHMTDSVCSHRIASIKKETPQNFRSDKWLGTYYYAFNTLRKPFDDFRVRKALSLVIDRQAIIDNFLKANQLPAFSLVPNGCGGMKTSEKIIKQQNISLAKKLLAEAGYPNGKGMPIIKITYNVSEQHKPIAEAIQQMWKTHLGVDAQLYNLSWPAYLSARRNKDFDVVRASWIGDFAEPETFLDMFTSTSALNHSSWKNGEYDKLMLKASNAKSKEQRLEYLSKAEEILIESSPIIPLYYYSRVYQILPNVKNWRENLLDYRDYKGVYLESDVKGVGE